MTKILKYNRFTKGEIHMNYLVRLYEANVSNECESVRVDLEYDRNWSKIKNVSNTYPHALFGYEYKLQDKYYVMILCTKISQKATESLSLYFVDKNNDELYYMDSLIHSFTTYFKFDSPKDRSIKLGQMNLEYFRFKNRIEKNENINDYLLDLLDYGMDIETVMCGYTKSNFPVEDDETNTYSIEVVFPKQPNYVDIKYVYYLSIVDRNVKNDIENNNSEVINGKFKSFQKKVKKYKLNSNIYFDKDVTRCLITIY